MSGQSLKDRVIASSAMLGAASVFGNVVRLLVVAYLARVLPTAQFGILGLAVVFAQLSQQVGVAGLDAYVIQRRDLDGVAVDSVFWMALCFTSVLAAGWTLTRSVIATWFHVPELAPYMLLISVTVVVSGVGSVPLSLLQRSLRYRDVAIAESAGNVAQAVVAVVLAAGGYGIWSLMWGYFAQEATKTAWYIWYSRYVPRVRFRIAAVRPSLRFGLPVLGDRFLTFLTLSADRPIIGRALGAGPLGVYVLAIEIVGFPARRVVSILARVLFPAMAELQTDISRMGAAYEKVARTLSIVVIPAFVGLALVAGDVVQAGLGARWQPLVTPLRVLCAVGVITALLTPSGAVLYGRGRPDLALRWSLLTAVTVPLAIILGARWGLASVAIAHSLAWVALFPVMVVIQAKLVRLPSWQLGRDYASGLARAVPVLIAVVAAEALASRLGSSSALSAAASIASGLGAYAIATWVADGGTLVRVLSRRPQSPSAVSGEA